MKIATMFDNFGPYHLSRLNAASEVCSLLGIEMHRESREYAWQPDIGPRGFESVTLSDTSAGPAVVYNMISRLQDSLEAFRPHCVFIPGWSARYALATLSWSRRHKVPAVLMSESTQRDAPRTRGKESVKSWIVSMCSAALVGGAPHVEYLAGLGMHRDCIFRGYDVVDNDYFHHQAMIARGRSSDLRKQFKLPQQYFLGVARFIPKKNLTWLISTYAKYREAFKGLVGNGKDSGDAEPWSLVLLGDGPERPTLERLISGLGLAQHVLLPGFKSYQDLPIYYGLAKAFVHASRSEPWGLVVNEAMASSLPVIVSTACGCAAELVREEHNGFLFDPTNPDQLVKLMLRASSQPGKLCDMGKIGLNRGPERFSRGMLAAAEKSLVIGSRSRGFWPGLLLKLLSNR